MSFLSGGASGGLASILGGGTTAGDVSSWANRIGQGANQIAQAGGAQAGYGGQAAPQSQQATPYQATPYEQPQNTLQGLVGQQTPLYTPNLTYYRGANSYFIPQGNQ